MKPALLYLAPWVAPGGADKGTVDWFRTIDRDAFDLHLITTGRSDNEFVPFLEPYATAVWNLPDLIDEIDFAPFILAYIESESVKLVHIMNSHLGFDLIPSIKHAFPDVPVVVQHHAEEVDKSGYVRYVASRYGHLVDAYSATSHDLKRRIASHGAPEGRITVIYTGIDAVEEWSLSGERYLRRKDDPLNILFAGRLEDQKDPHLMVEVARELRHRDVPFSIQVVGDGRLRQELETLVAEADLASSVVFQGVSYEMRTWYQRCDVLLMTSRFEGIPYVVFEAMAMEMPCVIPDVNANTELVDDEVGYIIDDRTAVRAYADALEALASMPERTRQVGAAARRRVLQRFPLERMAREHEALYWRLLAEPEAARDQLGGVSSQQVGR